MVVGWLGSGWPHVRGWPKRSGSAQSRCIFQRGRSQARRCWHQQFFRRETLRLEVISCLQKLEPDVLSRPKKPKLRASFRLQTLAADMAFHRFTYQRSGTPMIADTTALKLRSSSRPRKSRPKRSPIRAESTTAERITSRPQTSTLKCSLNQIPSPRQRNASSPPFAYDGEETVCAVDRKSVV